MAEIGVGLLGRGLQDSFHQLGGLGERCTCAPPAGSGAEPGQQNWLSHILSRPVGLCCLLSVAVACAIARLSTSSLV